jgi:hypothetical protein
MRVKSGSQIKGIRMENKRTKKNKENPAPESKPKYQPPKIIVYSSEEILEKIGPAQACSPFTCVPS